MIVGVAVIVSLVVFVFTLRQVRQEEASMLDDLRLRTALLADSFKESIRPSYLNNATSTMQMVLDKFANRERLLGLAVYNNKSGIFAVSAGLPAELTADASIPEQAMDADSVTSDFLAIEERGRTYIFATPLHQDEKVIGSLAVFQRADYIDDVINQIWKTNLVRWLVQILLFSIAVILILRWIIYRPILRLVESIHQARIGKTADDSAAIKNQGFFRPIAEEISKMSKSLLQARTAASEEARLRLEKVDSPWTEERLKEFVKASLKNQKIFLLFKGEPYTHKKGKDGIYCFSQAGGVLTALEPLMEACGGMWIAHGNGDADKETVDENDTIQVPPDNPKYTLKRIWLTEKEEQGYNKGYSAEGLYPLCLNTYTRPIFREEDWVEYKRVNGKFAKVLLGEIKNVEKPIIIVNEYHLTLAPQMVKASRPDARIGIFWHTPWPSAEAFNICPQRKKILEGMLGADIIGFHTQQFCNNFIDTIGKNVEAIVDFDKFSITRDEHASYIRPFPIGVAFTEEKKSDDSGMLGRKILDRFKIKTKYLGLGVDRLDYVKGIPERFKGIEYFLDAHPEYRGQFTFFQIASPCRSSIEQYLQYKDIVSQEAERINEKFKTEDWQPIVLEMVQYSHQDINSLYKLANVCVVTSLHDGMNLVAKEYTAERDDELGALVLSQFTGAAYDLKGALIINPYSTKEIADAIYKGITMSPLEQTRRMKTMRNSVKNYNIYRWAGELLKAVAEIS